jgi:hypothetical protein
MSKALDSCVSPGVHSTRQITSTTAVRSQQIRKKKDPVIRFCPEVFFEMVVAETLRRAVVTSSEVYHKRRDDPTKPVDRKGILRISGQMHRLFRHLFAHHSGD